ncbi:zona pellucida glycoprotein 3d tandem duplicate 1 [Alosa sapidissima]|uniref:zona pellucida glycoprotein 3d tandem duplicate 1 n=1 Tax=Alosa sapidissima TaxID=34773 RepID=UPI001C09A8EA|nr:zona pellucida glycoprotein 3d tandem duplicate 1 [Alosa sapidissima]
MVRAGLLIYFVVWCWAPYFVVEAGMQYNWGVQNVRGIFHFPEQKHFKSAPIHEVTWPGTAKDRPEPPQSTPPPFALPMFWHAPAPLASAALFKPVAGKHPLPYSLKDILLPHRYKPLSTQVRLSQELDIPRVEVSCGSNMVGVRVNRRYLGFNAEPSIFRLGTCAATFVTKEYVYFQYSLDECGSISETVKGKLVYSNTLTYFPGLQQGVLRVVPLSVPIHCQYNRFHYSYKVGYLPEVNDRIFLKSLKTRRTFNLTTLNAQWEHLDVGEKYVLGEPMYFEVSTQHLSKDQWVFVDSCHVTASQDSNSMPRQDVIRNFGCLVDSKRNESRSRFYSRDSNNLRFSIDTFLFPDVTIELLYLHCSVRVGSKDPTATAKSCTYNSESESWEELHGSNCVCSCCETKCEHSATSIPSEVKTLITSDPWGVKKRSSSLPEVEEVEWDGETWPIEKSRGFGSIQEMEDIWIEEPDKVASNQTESGLVGKDG